MPMNIMVERGFSGQLRSYGDFIYEYKITSDGCSKDDIVNFCKFVLNKRHLPEEQEYKETINSKESNVDMDYYVNGYYTIGESEEGWVFRTCQPYMD